MNFLVLIFLASLVSSTFGHSFGRCFTPDQWRGDCVYFTSCPTLLEIFNKRPANIKDRLFLSLSQCGYRDDIPLVCCREAQPEPTQPPPTETTPSTITPTQQSSRSQNNLLPKSPDCGIDATYRIYGGNVTEIDEYPWMVLLEYTNKNNRKSFLCGGSLINNRYVLTASHCVNGKAVKEKGWTLTGVRLGEWDTSTKTDCDDSFTEGTVCNNPPVDIPVEQMIPHPQYDPSTQHNDIALIRLSREVEFTTFIKPICLPLDSTIRDNLFEKQTLSVAGWGKTQTDSRSTVKLKVNVDGVSNSDCQRIYRSANHEIIESQVCAGGKKGVDSCRGDSGGPIMRQNERVAQPYWYLAGLVSYGHADCGTKNWPGVYTRVGSFIPWIEANVLP